jgi:hypothetical protein
MRLENSKPKIFENGVQDMECTAMDKWIEEIKEIMETARPNVGGGNEEIRQFIEMCFDPNSKMSVKLKDTLYQMMAGGGENG